MLRRREDDVSHELTLSRHFKSNRTATMRTTAAAAAAAAVQQQCSYSMCVQQYNVQDTARVAEPRPVTQQYTAVLGSY